MRDFWYEDEADEGFYSTEEVEGHPSSLKLAFWCTERAAAVILSPILLAPPAKSGVKAVYSRYRG